MKFLRDTPLEEALEASMHPLKRKEPTSFWWANLDLDQIRELLPNIGDSPEAMYYGCDLFRSYSPL